MSQRNYRVDLTGISGYIAHQHNIPWASTIDKWQKDPINKKNSKAGDDRYPAWRWIGCLYHDGTHVGIAADQLMTAIREGGAKVPTGKGQFTFKRQSQSGVLVNEILWPLITPKGVVPWSAVEALLQEEDFEANEQAARALGFELFVKGARVNMTKHIRVRPRFDTWRASGTVSVHDDVITTEVLTQILTQAGVYCGLGDWRPSAPKAPGPFGKFTVAVTPL